MGAFSLKSDKQFIAPFLNGQVLYVYTYLGEMKDLYTMPAISHCFNELFEDDPVEVSATFDLYYKALKVFGVTTDGEKFKELCKDLRSLEEVPGVENIFVNRLGLCIITMWRQHTASFISMRFEYCFCWSKYGVKVSRRNLMHSFRMWNKLDRGLVRSHSVETEEKNVELIACKRELEEKSKEMAALKNELEEKNVELAACNKELEEEKKKSTDLTTCKKELEWSKKMESLLIKLVEEKEKVNELMMKNQLLTSKSD